MYRSKDTDLSRVVVIDFETNGLSPERGDRVIEIGAVAVEDDKITDQFHSLINPGNPLMPSIENLTGISTQMLSAAPSSDEVFSEFDEFLGDSQLVAHNASFEQHFLDVEMYYDKGIACTMLIARRVYQDLRYFKLEDLVLQKELPEYNFHRALPDAKMTAHLWIMMRQDLKKKYSIEEVTFDLMCKLSKVPKEKVEDFLFKWKDNQNVRGTTKC